MSWRGQGGRRAKGRRGDQDPELDNTAWLAELEREAALADDDEDEDDWATTLRSRRPPPGQAPPAPDLAWSPPDQAPPAPDPGWSRPGPDPTAPDPGWDGPDPTAPDAGWSRTGPAPEDHRPFGTEPSQAGSGAWSPDPDPQDLPASPPPAGPDWSWRPPPLDVFEEPGPEAFADPWPAAEPGTDWNDPQAAPADAGWQPAGADAPTGAWSPADPLGQDPGYPNGQAPGHPAAEPGYASGEPGYPVGREPDYPALFGELYRRSAGQQDPIWEAPPPVEPLPEAGPPEPTTGSWPFEETTQSWEPSDRSFIWPPEELPSTSAEWDRPGSASWLDDPAPSPPVQPPPPASPLVAAGPPAAPAPPVAGAPPADWAAAIPTDVPAASRASDPAAATRMWRADQAADAEPGVPLAPAEEPAEVRRKEPSRHRRPAGDRQARSWPRIVAIISWIVLVMVVCWFYVFPWLERVLPESF
jgi:hypothetical protein